MTSYGDWPSSEEIRPPRLRGPAGSGNGTMGPPASGGPGLSIPAGTPTHPRPACRDYGEDGGGAGVGMEEDGTWGVDRNPKPPGSAHPRVRRDIPPARAAPRSPARRLSPEREPGRGQNATASAAPGPEPRWKASTCPQVPPLLAGTAAAAGAQKHFPISRQARRHRPGLARGRAGRRGLMEAGLLPG